MGWNSWTTGFQHSCSISLKMFPHCHSWSLSPNLFCICFWFPCGRFFLTSAVKITVARLRCKMLWLFRCAAWPKTGSTDRPSREKNKQTNNPHKFVLQLDKAVKSEFSTENVFSAKLKISTMFVLLFFTFKERWCKMLAFKRVFHYSLHESKSQWCFMGL